MFGMKCLLCLTLALIPLASAQYEPNWDSLDKRPLPSWYDEAKFGIFLHWGVFSVPSFGSEWFWNNWASGSKSYVDFMNKNYRPGFTYADFAPQFTAEFYEPDFWADLFKAAGAKYVVLTSKHHEGYTNWPSKFSFNWNAMDVGPKRDLVADLAKSIRARTDIKFGLYHSLLEWFHPLYLQDKKNNWQTRDFPTAKPMPELYEIVEAYKPEVIWSDGDWEAPEKYWNSTEFIAWLYNSSPVNQTVVVNDRWGSETRCLHGDFYNCNDGFNPGTLLKHKWENCMTVDKSSWGFRRNARLQDYRGIEELLSSLVSTVSCNGNLLLNVGPTHDGLIAPVFEERLRQLGQWLGVNGEAIYSSKPWKHQNDTLTPNVWYTSKVDAQTNSTVAYAIVLNWPKDNLLTLGAPVAGPKTAVQLLGGPSLAYTVGEKGMEISFPSLENIPNCKWAWTLKLTDLTN